MTFAVLKSTLPTPPPASTRTLASYIFPRFIPRLAHFLKWPVMEMCPHCRAVWRTLKNCGNEEDPEKIASMFSEDVTFELPGDTGALPWIGRNRGRRAVVDFVTSIRRLTTPVRFNVEDVLANETRAVIVLDLATKLNGTSETIETEACIVLEIRDGLIHRYLMIEDSFEVSRKARGTNTPR